MKRNFAAIIALPLIVAAVLATASACGDDDNGHGSDGMPGSNNTGMMGGGAPAGSIRVDLRNWAIEPAATSARAGEVTFYAVHDMGHRGDTKDEGGVTHDLQVMRKKADGSLEMAGQVQGLKMGQAKALTLNLAAGDYELSCNVVEQIGGKNIPHYAKGMRTEFKVTG